MSHWTLRVRRWERTLGSDKLAWAVPLVLFVAATSARLLFTLAFYGPEERVYSDMWVYDLRAKNLVFDTLTEWDTFTPVGYPALLALLYASTKNGVAAAGVMQAVMGGALSVLTQRVTIQTTRSHTLGLIAGIVIALYPPYFYYGALLLSELPFTFFMLLGAWLFIAGVRASSWPRLLFAGLTLGIATTIRPNLLLALPLLLAIAWFCTRGSARALSARLTLLFGLLLPLSAAAAHNSRLVKEKAGLSTNGGLNFYLNFAEVNSIHFEDAHIQPIPNAVRYREPEFTSRPFYHDRFFYEKGVRLLKDKPARLIRALDNFPESFLLGHQGYWPEWEKGTRFSLINLPFIFLVWGPALIHGTRLLFSRQLVRERDAAKPLLLALIASMLLTIYLFLGDPRMRVPFDAVALILALDALAVFVRRSTDEEQAQAAT
jgi:4-amino-4-deoxy-L-arabinose transferase-like glycosyltransferase